MNLRENMEKYAQMLLEVGLNLEKGQELVLSAAVESAEMVRILTEKAYQMGAKDVLINWSDAQCARSKYLYQDEETLKVVHDWNAEMLNSYARRGCAYMRLASDDPDAFKGIDAGRIAIARNALSAATKEAADCRMTGISPWLVAACPSEKWAQKVFPHLPQAQAVEKLWEAIFYATRADQQDPQARWAQHQQNLNRRVDWLSQQCFVSMHYQNAMGTDFTVGLPQEHIWSGGGSKLKNGRSYVPNMPTEEIFTAPHRAMANGKLVASLPLNHGGTLIEGFWLSFRDGRVVDYGAKSGEEGLKAILDTDEGAHYLGEIALIPADSPLSKMGILFYNTLFDENASCHFALGRAYADCVKGGEDMTEEQRLEAGLNQSLTHVDFMVGSEDLRITGTRTDGTCIPVFENGVWADA